MPEGDSVAGDAMRLRPLLEGREIVALDGSAGSVRSNSGRIVGQIVTAVRTAGKNLIVDFASGYSIRVHLGMTGRWVILDGDRRTPGRAKVALTTSTHRVACIDAPTVDMKRTKAIENDLHRLGPDVLSPDFDADAATRRAQTRLSDPIARVLLDQRVVAGIGNVYKSELSFLRGIHPLTRVGDLKSDQLTDLFTEAQTLLTANVGPGPRTTTGSRAPDRTTWVYGRAGRPCRRCSNRIMHQSLDGRATFWCPSCQPEPTTVAAS